MNKIFNLLFLFFSTLACAQIHEVGAFVGLSNFIGDVGRTNYIHPNKPALGLLYKWNKSPRHSYRFSYTQTYLRANDVISDEASRYLRAYNFDNNLKELSLALEFNFFDFNLHKEERKITPYVYTGISYIRHDELYIDSGVTYKENIESAFAIPLSLGIKSNINRFFVLAIELGARFTSTDNLDGSNPKNEDFKSLRFGNLNNNDVYVFSGLTLTYTFGEKPCYCAQ